MNDPPVIVIVDDDLAILQLIEAQLMPEHYTVHKFTDGLALLSDQALLDSCDLIISDIMMPTIDGFELCARIRSSQSRFLPILLVTALNETKFRVRGLDAGASDFITKPTNAAEFRARIRANLRTKELNDQLQSANQQLVELGELRDNLINMIVHDLRNPLQSVALSMELAGSPPDFSNIDETAWELTIQQVHQGYQLCDQLLDIKRMESGDMEAEPRQVSLPAVVDQAVKSLSLQASEHGIEVDFEVPKITWLTDPLLLQRILTNLLSNAIKYSRSGDSVKLTASLVDQFLEISIVDHGPGIPLEMQDKIFDLFVSSKTRASIRSAGIGLCFCKMAAEALGGSIRVNSIPGQGAEFVVRLALMSPTEEISK